MKIKLFLLITPLALAMMCASPSFAQDASATPGAAPSPHHKPKFEKPDKEGPLANLSPEEREKLKAAHEKAMQDPKVQAAHETLAAAQKAFQDALKAALLQADPSLGPILEKMEAWRKEHPEFHGPGHHSGGPQS